MEVLINGVKLLLTFSKIDKNSFGPVFILEAQVLMDSVLFVGPINLARKSKPF